MKVIDYVHILNMYAHKDTRVDFSEGKNYIVGPIGSGKTEILQAISFALFGTVALRDKSTSYKNIFVELCFNYKNEKFLIKRRINDASFLMYDKTTENFIEIVNSTSIVNQKIISLLGYNYDIFLLSNLCQQKKLAYFSELTPAKRLQYIDKISGIEEAKDLLKYLTSKRKSLKDNLALIKDVVVPPTLLKEIDPDFDYKTHIEILTNKVQSINELYNEVQKLTMSLPNRLQPISNPITEDHQVYLDLTESQLSICKEYIEQRDIFENLIYDLKESIKALETLPKYVSHLTLEEINTLINQHNLSVVNSVAKDIKITCTSCNATHDLNSLLDDSHCSPIDFKIKDLYNAQEYLSRGYDVIREQMEGELKQAINDRDDHITNEPIKGLNKYKNFASLIDYVNNARLLEKNYLESITKYELNNQNRQIILDQIDVLNKEINLRLEQQSSDIELKDKYTNYLIKLDIYKEHYRLYQQALEKYNNFKIELELINELIKEVNSITSNIKNQTIPLINYHASNFLNLITKGNMSSIEITEDYDLIVDGYRIGVKSGGQQDLASLAFRLSLSQSIISGMLPLFLADEVDSAGGEDDSTDIVEALDTISTNGFQIIMVTHKKTNNLENVNIIQL